MSNTSSNAGVLEAPKVAAPQAKAQEPKAPEPEAPKAEGPEPEAVQPETELAAQAKAVAETRVKAAETAADKAKAAQVALARADGNDKAKAEAKVFEADTTAKALGVSALLATAVQAVCGGKAGLAALTRLNGGELAKVGGHILKWAVAAGLHAEGTEAKPGPIMDKLKAEVTYLAFKSGKTLIFDEGFARRAVKAHAARSTANSLGCYVAWSLAADDKAAQAVLDKAAGTVRKARKAQTKLQRALSAIGNLENAEDIAAAQNALNERKAAADKVKGKGK